MYLNLFGDLETSCILDEMGNDPDDIRDAYLVAYRLYGSALFGVWEADKVAEWKKMMLNDY